MPPLLKPDFFACNPFFIYLISNGNGCDCLAPLKKGGKSLEICVFPYSWAAGRRQGSQIPGDRMMSSCTYPVTNQETVWCNTLPRANLLAGKAMPMCLTHAFMID